MTWRAAFFLLLVLSLVYAQDGALDVNKRAAIHDVDRDVSERDAEDIRDVKYWHGPLTTTHRIDEDKPAKLWHDPGPD